MALTSKHQRISAAAFGAALAAALPAAAAAQTPGQPEATSETGNQGLEEIVVTAQRRAENLNDVGLSVSTASGDELRDRGVADLSDLTALVPGLTYTETPYGTGVLTMRGIGFYESSMAASSPVATYLDEIPLPYPRLAAGATLDLERVEILKGPQGTLFGQNTTGGLINYVSARPTDTPEAGLNVSFGRFLEADAEGFVSGPIADGLNARFAVRTRHSAGWQRSATRDDEHGATHVTAGRLRLDWEASPNIRFEFLAHGFIDTSDTQAGQAIGLFPGVPAAVQPQQLTAALIPPGRNRLADWGAGQDFARDNNFFQLALRSTFDLSDRASLISITSYLEYVQDQLIDADGSALETADVSQDGYIHSFSQELRLQGELGALRYVLGGNYSDDAIYDNTVFMVGDSSLAVGVPGLPIRFSRTYSNQSAETWAVFGNLDFVISDQLKLQGGLRYTEQQRSFSGCIGDNGDGAWATLFSVVYGAAIPAGGCTTLNPFTGAIGLHRDSLEEDNLSWRLNLNYQPNRDLLFYANVSRGYKAGNFPTVGGVVSVQYAPATQESVLAYEAGAKLTLANGRLQLNGAAFYYDYSDKQFRGKILDSFFGSIERVYNVPESRVVGFELEAQAIPAEGLSLSLTLAFTDTEIESDFAGLTPIGTPIDLRGETFEFTPRWAIGASLAYERPIGDSLMGSFAINASHQSDTHAGYGGLGLFAIDSYTLVNARLGIAAEDRTWNAQLWVRNLFNEYYVTNANYLGEFAYRLTGMPITWGVSAGLRF